MPALYSWLIDSPAVPSPGVPIPTFPVNAGPGPTACNGVMHDQSYFLSLFDRLYDPGYLVPLKVNTNSGYESFQGFAKIGERLSLATERLECGAFVIFAAGGSFATVMVEFYRPNTGLLAAVVVRAGSVVTTSDGARDFVTTQDAVFPPLSLGPIAVPATAIAMGWEWNVPGQRTTARGETLPGEIDTCKALIQGKDSLAVTAQWNGNNPLPNNTNTPHFYAVTTSGAFGFVGQLLFDNGSSVGTVSVIPTTDGQSIFVTVALSGGTISLAAGTYYQWHATGASWQVDTVPLAQTFVDGSIAVRQVGDATGGAAPMLDGLGDDQAMPRAPGEGDPAYRLRLRTLPDTVSPGAIIRFAHSVFDPFKLAFVFEETWQSNYQTCWDAPNQTFPANPTYDPNLFCFDDPRPAWDTVNHPACPFFNRWLDELEYRGAFVIAAPPLPAMADVGLAYDDTASTPAALNTTVGRRAANAYDVDSTFTAALAGGYDGFDLPRQAVYLGLWQTLQQIKLAGVAAVVELQGN